MADYDSAYTGAQIDTGIGKAYTAVQPGDIDSSLSDSSENAVQNKVIKAALDGKEDDGTAYSMLQIHEIASTSHSTMRVTQWSEVNTINGNNKVPSAKLVRDSLAEKVDKVDGKDLSTNDFTDAYKDKLDGIASGATAVTSLTVSGWGFAKKLVFTEIGSQPITIATSVWSSDNTYADYPYAATISGLTDVTSSMFAEVVFAPSDAASGNLAAVCSTGTSSVTVYAKTVPDAAISVPVIVVWG